MLTAILNLKFPFELKDDQRMAVNAWLNNNFKGSIIYSTGTGKTEIAFECARRLAEINDNNDVALSPKSESYNKPNQEFRILFLVPRIVLIEQNVNRLISLRRVKRIHWHIFWRTERHKGNYYRDLSKRYKSFRPHQRFRHANS